METFSFNKRSRQFDKAASSQIKPNHIQGRPNAAFVEQRGLVLVNQYEGCLMIILQGGPKK